MTHDFLQELVRHRWIIECPAHDVPMLPTAFRQCGAVSSTTANLPRQKPTAGCPPWRRDRRHLGISEQRTVERFAVVLGVIAYPLWAPMPMHGRLGRGMLLVGYCVRDWAPHARRRCYVWLRSAGVDAHTPDCRVFPWRREAARTREGARERDPGIQTCQRGKGRRRGRTPRACQDAVMALPP